VSATGAHPDGTTPRGWLEERTRLSVLLAALLHVRIPMSARTWYFGGIALFLFGIQAATGTLLALYYKPTPDAAYESVRFITSDVSFGWLIRSIHHWAANLMLLFVLLHLLRVFYQGAYKYPRELTWLFGAGLLAMTIGFGFTGYLLPWDQKAYWATVVGTNIAADVPVIGGELLLLLRGGPDVTEATLSRFFGIHVLVLPIALAGLLAIHLVLVHQLGLANPKRPEPRPGTVTAGAGPGAAASAEERQRPFWPHYMVDELVAWYVVLAALVVLASLFPAGLEGQANPLDTPAHIKPEWYFLAVYELLKYVPKTVGILLPFVVVALITFWPFLDRSPEVLVRRRKLVTLAATALLAAAAVLTVMGHVS
jgi:ubiquinol-cytochrome c reductase cytochrome b subunit